MANIKKFNIHQASGHIIDILNNLPAMIAWKNKQSIFLGGNMQAAKFAGFKSNLALEGISDHDLKSPVSEYADEFITQDFEVISKKKPINILGIHTYEDNVTKILMTTKSPLVEQKSGEIIGTVYHSTIITNNFLTILSSKLLRIDYPFSSFITTKQQCYYIKNTYDKYNLSPRESECLFYLLRGKKTCQIAQFLHISTRTVETHCEHIKNKMGCNFLSEVIEQAIADGYLFMVPNICLQNPCF